MKLSHTALAILAALSQTIRCIHPKSPSLLASLCIGHRCIPQCVQLAEAERAAPLTSTGRSQ